MTEGQQPRIPRKIKSNNREGIACDKCGSRLWFVTSTRPKPNCIKRFKICRHCGRKRTTIETAAD